MINPTEQALNLWDLPTQAFLASQGWDGSGSTWLLAVSGGADSIAMLHWARRTAPRAGSVLAVAHVNHRLRPGADTDRDFVLGICERFGIPCFTRDLDPAFRPVRESVEMWARRERYAFFEAAADSLPDVKPGMGPIWILTAHQRDDLVETLFQRLGRGTGPRGLRGIPFRRGRIVRPLLSRSRAEVLAVLGLQGAAWREDESNADTAIDRNWYRHRYLPFLRHAEPGLDARLFSMAMDVQAIGKGFDALEAEEALLQSDAHGVPRLSREGVGIKVTEEDLESLDFWVRGLLRASFPASAASVASRRPVRVTKEILREFIRQWRNGPETLQVRLNGAMSLNCRNQGIYCVETASIDPKGQGWGKKYCPPPVQRVILIEGSSHVSWQWEGRNYTLKARRYPRPQRLEFPAPAEERAIFDADLFSCTLVIRTRQDGDRFSPLGTASRSRKLKTFFNEEKIPIGKRDSLPIVISGQSPDEETPAWVPGYGMSDFFKVSGSTSHILELVLTCENP
ncbi:MAG: tRNA lysidine(34) synthetase TilS [Fibrobacteria bacterium]